MEREAEVYRGGYMHVMRRRSERKRVRWIKRPKCIEEDTCMS
jgi:hypothetical protein